MGPDPSQTGADTSGEAIRAQIYDADTLYGDAGDNQLQGWAGNNWLIGLSGNDTLNGDLGNDTLVFYA